MNSKVPSSAGKKRPPGGSRKGKPNKITADLKAMILGALDKAGGEDYLLEQAEKNPTAFMTLIGKVLPMQVTGEGGKALVLKVVTAVPDAAAE